VSDSESKSQEIIDRGLAERVADRIGSFGKKLKNSQLRAELRVTERSALRIRSELARLLLGSPDLPAEIPLTPRLASTRDELRRFASQVDDSSATRDAEIDREKALESEKNQTVAPLRHALETIEQIREEVRIREERAAREGLSIARRRENLDRELQSPPTEHETEFELLRRRHAIEELEAIERRASNLTAEREQLTREVIAADKRLSEARSEYSSRTAEWDAPLAEARAHRHGAEARIQGLERLSRNAFDLVADEAVAWADSWKRLAEQPDDSVVGRHLANLSELEKRRDALTRQLATAGAASQTGKKPAGESRLFVWIAVAGVGMLFLAVSVVVVLVWFWLGRSSAPAKSPQGITTTAAAKIDIPEVLQLLRQQGFVLKSEEIAYATVGALDGRRIFPFADEAAGVELFEFASENQARETRRRMERLLPDPRDSFFAENSDQAGRFLIWGLAQLPPKARRALRNGFHSAAVQR